MSQSLQEILRELREFRAQQPPHDLSVLRRRYKPAREVVESEPVEEQPKQKKSKRNKGSESNEQE